MSIRFKLIISYILLIFISFSIIGVFFNLMIRNFLINEARQNLIRQGSVIQRLYNGRISTPEALQSIRYMPQFRVGGKIFDGDLLVVDLNGDIVYSSKQNPFGGGNRIEYAILDKITKEGSYNSIKIGNIDVVAAVFPIISNISGKVIGSIVMYTLVKGIKIASLQIVGVLLKGFLVSGIISLIIGYLLSKSISAPIAKLTEVVEKIKNKKFGEKVEIKSDGEIKLLADAFNDMSVELRNYYTSQRRFLQNASHELKTPLMSIQGYAEGIKDGVIESDDIPKSLDIIIDESIRLRDIVNDLMYLTKLETHQEGLKMHKEYLKDIFDECIEKIMPQLNKKKIKINYNGNDAVVKCDRRKLIQAFMNILSNGVRYAKTAIDVETHNHKDHVEIKIKNDGRKFTDEELNNMFERFFKGDEGETGIGLAITKAIVEWHGGTIEAFNTDGGVCFLIKLRIA
ncbi:HAMP domain-containing sensor histidine kinase [Thermoanaerobacterium thermosaccharolyticum]|uniref:sensor histidine kinase n=1 Tax=Thermoanaerobacterium thermosaccharolyticum TaxID=1517 RepID=UPI002FDA717F